MSRILRISPLLRPRGRFHSNFYEFLGVSHNAPAESIASAIQSKENLIRSELKSDPKNTRLGQSLVLLKKMNKVLLDPEKRHEYNFSVRESIAKSIHQINPQLKQLDAGDEGDNSSEKSPKVYSRVSKKTNYWLTRNF